MTSALLFLTQCRLRNQWRRFLSRAARPRYLLVYALGAAYLWMVFLGPFRISQRPAQSARHVMDLLAPLFGLMALRWWLMEDDRGPLAFTPAELTFLFPAPITRRQLIRFKLARVQVILLVSALVSSLLARRTGLGIAPNLLRAVAFWVCYGTLYLHRLGAALSRATLAERGSAGRWRRTALVLALVTAIGIPCLFVVREWPALSLGWQLGLPAFVSALGQVVDQPAVAVLLWPIRALLRPTVAPNLAEWGRAMIPAVGLLLIHLVWLLGADHAFEEAAVAASSRRAERLSQKPDRTGPRRRRSLPLPGGASPSATVAWKNLLAQGRAISMPTLLALGVPIIGTLIFGVMEDTGSLRQILGWFGLFWAGFMILIGPQWIRYDVRRDLARMDLLRSYPVSGRAIMTGEIAASALILTGFQLVLLAVAVGGLWTLDEDGMTPMLLVAGYAGLMLLLPMTNWFTVGIYNAGALLYPEWVRRERRPGGIEATGQNVVALVATAGLLGLVLAAPVAAGAALSLGMWERVGPLALVPGSLVTLIGLLLEAGLFAAWLGRRFDRYDPSAVRLAPIP
jgi:hypothetical protein